MKTRGRMRSKCHTLLFYFADESLMGAMVMFVIIIVGVDFPVTRSARLRKKILRWEVARVVRRGRGRKCFEAKRTQKEMWLRTGIQEMGVEYKTEMTKWIEERKRFILIVSAGKPSKPSKPPLLPSHHLPSPRKIYFWVLTSPIYVYQATIFPKGAEI